MKNVEALEPRQLLSTSVYVSDLPTVSSTNGWGPAERDMSNGEQSARDGHALTITGQVFAKGMGVHAASDLKYSLGGSYGTFSATVGIDDEVWHLGSVVFQVWADGAKLYDSGTVTGSGGSRSVSVDVTGRQTLDLIVTNAGDGNNYDHADWGGASLTLASPPTSPPPVSPPPATGSRLYVSTTGSDANSGTTPTSPVRTIQHAADLATANNLAGIASDVIVMPGLYRESVSMGANARATNAAITIEAATPGTVTITGSDAWAGGWTQQAGGTQTHTWNFAYGTAANPWVSYGISIAPVVLRREMIYVNGTLYSQVMSSGGMTNNSFYVDETKHVITVKTSTNLNAAAVEVATRAGVFSANNRTNLSLSGIEVTHDGNFLTGSSAVQFTNCTNCAVANCTVQWNNGGGVGLSTVRGASLANDTISNNGSTGLGGYQIANEAVVGCVVTGNNWRGAWGGYYWWSVAGIKQLYLNGANFTDCTVSNNYCAGVWLDTDATNVVMARVTLSGNSGYGMFLEATLGPVSFDAGSISNNGNNGILLANAGGVSVTNTRLAGDGGGSEISVSGSPGGRWDTDWSTGQLIDTFDDRLTLSGDTFVSTFSGHVAIDTTMGGADWTRFMGTLHSDGNTFVNMPTVARRDNGVPLTLSQWQTYSGQDRHSTA